MAGRAPREEERAWIVSGETAFLAGKDSPVMSLSEFMPYGAPELIEGAAPRMARSTMIATGLVAAIVWLAGALASGTRELPPPVLVPPEYIQLLREPEVPRALQRAYAPPVRPAPPANAELRPLPDAPLEDPPTIDTDLVDGPPPVNPDEQDAARGVARGDAPPLPDPEIGVRFDVDVLPQPVRCADAVYPDIAREAGVEGTVRVQMLIGLTGRVERAVLEPGSRTSMLDEAALAAARTCVFTPALSGGHPIKVWMGQAYRFRLH